MPKVTALTAPSGKDDTTADAKGNAPETKSSKTETKSGAKADADSGAGSDSKGKDDAVSGKADRSSAKPDSSKPASSGAGAAKADTSKSGDASPGGALLGSDASVYLEDVSKYTSDVKEDVVGSILAYFGDNVNNRDAMTVACSQQKELSYIKKNFLKGKLGLKESNKTLDRAMNDICDQMGKSNRNKSSLTFYYLLTEKFNKFSVWK